MIRSVKWVMPPLAAVNERFHNTVKNTYYCSKRARAQAKAEELRKFSK